MKGIRSMINNILNADKLGKQVEACNKLERGVEAYVKDEVIKELESMTVRYHENSFPISLLINRVQELKNSNCGADLHQ